ncbi:MAG: ABC transporter substrate-binding protein, partial [Pseudomonadota bacterium]
MYDKEKDLIDAFLRGQMDRRALLRGLGALGVTASTAGVLLNSAATRAMAADFDWQRHAGTGVKLLLNK